MLELGELDRVAGELLRAAGGHGGHRNGVGPLNGAGRAVAVMLPSGSKRTLGVATSSYTTKIWHVRFSGTGAYSRPPTSPGSRRRGPPRRWRPAGPTPLKRARPAPLDLPLGALDRGFVDLAPQGPDLVLQEHVPREEADREHGRRAQRNTVRVQILPDTGDHWPTRDATRGSLCLDHPHNLAAKRIIPTTPPATSQKSFVSSSAHPNQGRAIGLRLMRSFRTVLAQPPGCNRCRYIVPWPKICSTG